LGVRFEVEEAIPHDGRGGLDVPHHEAGSGESHVVLVLDALAVADAAGLFRGESRQDERQRFGGGADDTPPEAAASVATIAFSSRAASMICTSTFRWGAGSSSGVVVDVAAEAVVDEGGVLLLGSFTPLLAGVPFTSSATLVVRTAIFSYLSS